MSLTSSVGTAAPYLLVGAVIMGILGYLFFLIGEGKKLFMVAPPPTIPPPETSTNYLTEAIGNGLSASGMANIERRNNRPRNMNASVEYPNTAQRNVVESALSKGV